MNEAKKSGRAVGGHARAASLSREERSSIAKRAAKARWGDELPKATHFGSLVIGQLELPCAVLPDGTRVISQGGIATAFGPATGGGQGRRAKNEDGGDLPPYLVAGSLKPFIDADLRTTVTNPLRYRDPRGGPVRIGIEATMLPKVCDVWLKARDADALTKSQRPVASRADILMRGLAHTGIVALVDEATGFQDDRAKNALAEILELFIAKELQMWVKTFPTDFYRELFRLRGLDYRSDTVKRPQYFGVLTNDIVYKRLAPGVLEELQEITPKTAKGNRRNKYFQWLTKNAGYPKLREHLGSVVAIMKLSSSYVDFKQKLDQIHPKHNETRPLPFGYDEDDSGHGI